MINITVQSDTSLEFASSIRELFRIWALVINGGKKEEIIVDLSNCRFCKCSFLLGLHLLYKDFVKQGYNISLKTNCSNKAFGSYLNLTSFDEGLNPNNFSSNEVDQLFERFKNKTYLPLLNFPASAMAEDIRIRESIMDSLSQSIESKLKLEPQIRGAVTYLIDEAVNNIKDHARTLRGYIITQFYPKRQYMDICIADLGVSLLGSYKAVGRTDIITPEQALQAALNGDSTKDDPGRGFGIRTSRRMLVQGLGGRYFMMSGNAFLYSLPARKETIQVIDENIGIQWNGTFVALRIPIQTNSTFEMTQYLE